jgi:tRNA threonylcarbamoyladenosine biosynthesis protein TsaB
VLVLAFDTATEVATAALVLDGAVLGERETVAKRLLMAVDELLRQVPASPWDLGGIVVGTGPGSFTSTRIGLATARGLAVALGLPAAGVSTLDALRAGAPGAFPVIDAKRGEVFVSGPRAVRPAALAVPPGVLCVGDGAVRYRAVLEDRGASIPPDDSHLHRPRARFHASLAERFGPVEEILPVYVRAPDADRVLS